VKAIVTVGSRFFLTLAMLAVVAAVIAGWGDKGGLSGSVSFGLLGGVGDHLAVTVLGFLALAATFICGVTTALRDADAEAVTAVAGVDRLPEATAPRTANYWPVIAAFAAGVMMVGLASSPVLFLVGAIIAGISLVEWMVHAWADRATGDPEANVQIRNRFMYPIEIPLFGALAIVVLVLCLSRVLLAVSEIGSDIIAAGFALVVLVTATILALRPQLKKAVLTVVLVILAVVVITAGIIGAAHGTRDYEKHEGMSARVEAV
jgi:uncharacterized membrane protein